MTINSTPIPLLYVSSTLVLGIVPYSATGSGAVIGGTVTLILTFANSPSSPVTIGLAAATPGLFTVSRSDTGKTVVKAVNSDGTLNGPDNPAVAGSVMALYAGGLGLVTPTFTAGQIAPGDSLFTTTATTFVSIAGAPATVLFSGLAPGTIGAYQVNIQIPSGIASGAQPFATAGELADDRLIRFPQLIIAPALVAIIWSGLFDRFAPIDVDAMLRAHLDTLFDGAGP